MSHYFFFFNDTATTEIYTLSLHDALPISRAARAPATTDSIVSSSAPKTIGPSSARSSSSSRPRTSLARDSSGAFTVNLTLDRKSTRLNSSHVNISYAVFCLKKKKITSLSRLRKTIENNKRNDYHSVKIQQITNSYDVLRYFQVTFALIKHVNFKYY